MGRKSRTKRSPQRSPYSAQVVVDLLESRDAPGTILDLAIAATFDSVGHSTDYLSEAPAEYRPSSAEVDRTDGVAWTDQQRSSEKQSAPESTSIFVGMDETSPSSSSPTPFTLPEIQPLQLDAPRQALPSEQPWQFNFDWQTAQQTSKVNDQSSQQPSASPSGDIPTRSSSATSTQQLASTATPNGQTTTLTNASAAPTAASTDKSSPSEPIDTTWFGGMMAPGGGGDSGGGSIDSYTDGNQSQSMVQGGSPQYLYVLDWNDGLTLDPSATEYDHENSYVDLRAQTTKAVSSFSWNLSGASRASGVTGTSTYNLKFNWSDDAAYGFHDVAQSIVLNITYADATTDSKTFHFMVMNDNGTLSGPASVSRSMVTSPDQIASGASYLPGDYHAVGAAAGNLVVSHGVPSYGARAANLGLAYDSEQANPNPVFLVRYAIDPTVAVPPKVSAELTLNGTTSQRYYYDTSSLIPGDIVQMALQGDATGLATGRYSYSISVKAHYGSGDVTTTSSGSVNIINRSASDVGQGWRIDGLQRLYAVTGGVMLDVGPYSLWFADNGSGGYTTPAGDFSTLVKNGNNTYTRTLKDGTAFNFSTTGYLSTVVDTNSNTVTFGYNGSNQLTTITDSNSLVTTYAYSSGKLSTITDPASRVTTLSYTSAKLTGITDPDSAAWAYAYNSAGKMTSLTNPRSKTTSFAYTSDRVSTVTRADSTTETYSPHQLDGWVAAGSGTSGSPATAILAAASATGVTNGRSYNSTYRFDWTGFGATVGDIDQLGDWGVVHRDANGLGWEATDRINRNEKFTFDSKGNVTYNFHADGTNQAFTYNSLSRMTGQTDEGGNSYAFTYDSYGNQLTATDPLSRVTTNTYTGDGKLSTVTDPASHVTTYGYDSYDRVTSITQPAVGGTSPVTSYTYNSAGDVLTVTDPLSHVTTYTYDSMGRLLTDKKPDGTPGSSSDNPVYTYTYDGVGNVLTITDPLSHVTTYTYDNRDRLLTSTNALSQTTTLGYDNEGNLTSTTNALGKTWTSAYDAADRKTSDTDPLSHTTTYTMDAMGQVTAVTNALSQAATATYTSRGLNSSVVDPTSRVTSQSFSNQGWMMSSTASGGGHNRTTSYTRDALGRTTVVTDATSRTTTYTYNSAGLVATEKDTANNTTTYAYDALDRVTSVTNPNSQTTATYTYDLKGNKLTETDGLSRTTTYTYDEQDRLLTVTDPLSHTTTYAYDLTGRLSSVTDASSNVTSYTYDNADRLTVETDPRSKTTTYVYDAAGQQTEVTDRNGKTRKFTYDDAGRETYEKWYNGATLVRTITYSYDNANQLTSVSDPDSTYSYTYDGAGRMTEVDNNGTSGAPRVILDYTYDERGNVLTVADNNSATTTYTWDDADRITSVNLQVTGKTSKPLVDFTYDSVGRLATMYRHQYGTSIGGSSGGGGSTVGVSKSVFGYDASSRMTSIAHQSGGTMGTYTSVRTYTYSWNAAYELTQEVSYDGTENYTYDSGGQLTAASGWRSESYSFDSTGNRNMSGYSTGTGNRTTSDGTYNYTYDDEGNLTKKTKISNGEYTDYTWDYRNRLTSVVKKTSGGTTLQSSDYTYDAFDKRIKLVDSVGTSQTRWTFYDGLNPYADFDSGGTLTKRYMYGREIDSLLARWSPSDTFDWYLGDMQGTVRDIADKNAVIQNHVTYDAFGKVLSESSPTVGDRFKYTGREYDSATGLYYYRARYYDTNTGKFIGQDPIKFSGGDANIYRYAQNNPTANVDPTGLYYQDGVEHRMNVQDRMMLEQAKWQPISDAYQVRMRTETAFSNAQSELLRARGEAAALRVHKALYFLENYWDKYYEEQKKAGTLTRLEAGIERDRQRLIDGLRKVHQMTLSGDYYMRYYYGSRSSKNETEAASYRQRSKMYPDIWINENYWKASQDRQAEVLYHEWYRVTQNLGKSYWWENDYDTTWTDSSGSYRNIPPPTAIYDVYYWDKITDFGASNYDTYSRKEEHNQSGR